MFPPSLQNTLISRMRAIPDVVSHMFLESMLWMDRSEWCYEFKFWSLMASPKQEQKNPWNSRKMKKHIIRKSKAEVHIDNKRVCLNLCPVKLIFWYLMQHWMYLKNMLQLSYLFVWGKVIANPEADGKRQTLLYAWFKKACRKEVGNKILLLFPNDSRSAAWIEFNFCWQEFKGGVEISA